MVGIKTMDFGSYYFNVTRIYQYLTANNNNKEGETSWSYEPLR
jgi:hypothetical protein